MRRILVLAGGLCFAGALYADTAAYTYNGAGRLASVVYPDGTVVSYAYDAAGNLTARTVTSGGGGNSAPKAKPGKKPATKRRAERGGSTARLQTHAD